MSLEPGRKLGPYEVVEAIGAGGMGEVYKARDTRLERTVAIKVLPAHLADDPGLRKRFEQEARTVSNLNHPGICTLHDIGSESGIDFLVMEYVEGETLAERLRRGALPLAEALRYARQIAEALDRAHRSGVVHRDLKPGNVMLTKGGVKLLDFGLAKLQPQAIDPALSSIATQHKPLTREGAIVGTLHYMSPEQLEGKEVDLRSDLFSLGAVLYEMVTGRRAFEGETPASIITAVMSASPGAMAALVPVTPPALERLVSACLAKDPDERWQSAGDLNRALSWVMEAREPEVRRTSSRSAWLVAGIFAVLAASLLTVVLVRPEPERWLVRFSLDPPEGTTWTSWGGSARFDVSPDGTRIAVAVQDGVDTHLAVRDLAGHTRMVGAVGRFARPYWTPDGRSLLYAQGRRLMELDAEGGVPRTVTVSDGMILGATSNGEAVVIGSAMGLLRVDRGEEALTRVEEGEASPAWPEFLPDGEQLVYLARGGDPEKSGIYLLSLESKERRFLRTAESGAQFVEPGYLLFAEGETLWAQRFLPSHGRVEGRAVPLAQNLRTLRGAPSFSASEELLVYSEGVLERQLTWLDRDGRPLGTVGDPGPMSTFSLSADGRRAAVVRPDGLWLVDLERDGIETRLASAGDARLADPTWAADGREIVYSHNSGPEGPRLYRQSLAAGSEPELALSWERAVWADQWLPDDQLTFHDGRTIGLLPMDGTSEPRVLVTGETLDEPHRSPDGGWLAFISDETGRHEVYVEKLDTRDRVRASAEGGGQPRFSADGRELFFLSGDGAVMAVGFDPERGVEGVAQRLFEAPLDEFHPNVDQWAPHPDGERFLFLVPAGGSLPLRVVVNWQSMLGERD